MPEEPATSVNSDGPHQRALESGQFFLVYQPEFDLATNAFVGVESLLRWQHPTRGVLLPKEFLAGLEESGEITVVGRWAMQSACVQGAEWHDMGYRFSVSVNVSSRQLSAVGFVDDVERILNDSRFSASYLILEVSHKSISSDATLATTAQRLREMGVRIAVDDIEIEDDFSVLDETSPIDVIKLDRRFVAQISEESAIHKLRLLVDAARIRGLQVVAAGVEDAAQRTLLEFGHVGIGQGYHFSVPRDASSINQMLLDFSIFSGKPLYTE